MQNGSTLCIVYGQHATIYTVYQIPLIMSSLNGVKKWVMNHFINEH